MRRLLFALIVALLPIAAVAQVVTITPSASAFAPYTGPYLPLAGGTLTGPLTIGAGSAITSSGAGGALGGLAFLSSVDLTTNVTGILPGANGGTGATTLTAHGLLVGNGTGPVAVTGAGTSGQVFTSNGAAADGTFQALPASATGANPTATIGTAAVNGSASTFMRSDGAPAIPQASTSTFGAVKCDGTTITCTAGVISTGLGGVKYSLVSSTAISGTPTYVTVTGVTATDLLVYLKGMATSTTGTVLLIAFTTDGMNWSSDYSLGSTVLSTSAAYMVIDVTGLSTGVGAAVLSEAASSSAPSGTVPTASAGPSNGLSFYTATPTPITGFRISTNIDTWANVGSLNVYGR